MARDKSGVMKSTSSHRFLGVPAYFPQAEKVLPERKVQGSVKVRLDSKTITILKPPTGKGETMEKKIDEWRRRYPKLEVLGPV
jgi:hypothetical protein